MTLKYSTIEKYYSSKVSHNFASKKVKSAKYKTIQNEHYVKMQFRKARSCSMDILTSLIWHYEVEV